MHYKKTKVITKPIEYVFGQTKPRKRTKDENKIKNYQYAKTQTIKTIRCYLNIMFINSNDTYTTSP